MKETKNCPYCGELIMAAAKKCRHCDEWLEQPTISKIEESPVNDYKLDKTNIIARLETSINSYVASHAKKFTSVFLVGYNLSDELVLQHKKYAPIGDSEKVLMAVNKIRLYPFSGLGIIITDRFLYYRLVNHNFKVIPLVTMFKKKTCRGNSFN